MITFLIGFTVGGVVSFAVATFVWRNNKKALNRIDKATDILIK